MNGFELQMHHRALRQEKVLANMRNFEKANPVLKFVATVADKLNISKAKQEEDMGIPTIYVSPFSGKSVLLNQKKKGSFYPAKPPGR